MSLGWLTNVRCCSYSYSRTAAARARRALTIACQLWLCALQPQHDSACLYACMLTAACYVSYDHMYMYTDDEDEDESEEED
jgi:hypothetical protein